MNDHSPLEDAVSDVFDSDPASSATRAAEMGSGEAARSKPSPASVPSARAEESFADLDQAPPAPLTPSRGMPAVSAPRRELDSSPAVSAPRRELDSSPAVSAPRRELDSSPAVSVSADEDREDTTVGEVPRDLLELSVEREDECTRAYTAPQELIELAKRKREERLKAKAEKVSPEAHLRPTERPPAQRRAAGASELLDAVPKAPRAVSDIDASHGSSEQSQARLAPGANGAASGSFPGGKFPGSKAPASVNEGPSAASERQASESAPVVSTVKSRGEISPESLANWVQSYKMPWHGAAPRWLFILGFFLIAGFALARWAGLAELLTR